MKPLCHFYAYFKRFTTFTTLNKINFIGRPIIRLATKNRALLYLAIFPKIVITMDFLNHCHKSVNGIKDVATGLKMKLLRRSVPQEHLKNDVNTIIDMCIALITDTENEMKKYNKDKDGTITQNLETHSTNDSMLLREASLIDDIPDDFFDEDQSNFGSFTPHPALSSTKVAETRFPSADGDRLATAITKAHTSSQNSKKRSSICISPPVLIESPPKKGNYTEDDSGWVPVYIDGSCLGNGMGRARAGLGVWFSNNSTLNVSEPVKGRLTNNVGEIEAAIRAIEQAHSVGITKLLIRSDSMFMINCMTKWRFAWEKNGWKTSAGKPVINRPEIENLVKALNDTKMAVRWEHVKAHSNIEGNEAADVLAKKGADKCAFRGVLK